MIKAVVFDFDGVIADTEPLHYSCFQKVLSRFGISYSWNEYLEKYIGYDDRDAFKEVFRINGRGGELTLELLSSLVKEKAALFPQIAVEQIVAYPGVESLLLSLHGKYPLAICSGALRTDILPVLRKLNIINVFDDIITADDVAVSKPDPEGYLLAVKRLSEKFPEKGISASCSIAIEDTPAGITSAKRAGMKVVAVTNSHDPAELEAADMIVDSLCGLAFDNL